MQQVRRYKGALMATTYGDRLKKALEYRAIGQREFARRIKELVSKGGSYRSLSNYLTNVFTPTQEWTQAAAQLLGVSETWLGSHEGQMLPKKPDDPIISSCIWALDGLRPYLSANSDISTFAHLMLARDRFEDVYGDTRGMKGAEAKQSYARHLLLPLKLLLLHIRGSDEFAENVGPEIIRCAISQYLELVLLLMPAQDVVGDEDRKAVSRCLSEWMKKREEEGQASLEDGVRAYHEANPDALRKHFESNPKTEEEV